MSEPYQNELSYVACSAVSIGHAIWPSTYAGDAEVASRLEPTSKCMVMCFLVRLANPFKIASFSVKGVSLAFFSSTFNSF